MFNAFNKSGTIVYAETSIKGGKYYCPCCKGEVILKKGDRNVAHFAHKAKQVCPYEEDRDYMTDWHIRMQSYFPKESREVFFTDKQTKEVRRADVYIKEKDTIIEFQKSPMSTEEYAARSNFYLRNGHKIVWVFDESTEKPKEGDIGKLRMEDVYVQLDFPHDKLGFKWLNHRKCMPKEGEPLDIKKSNLNPSFAVFIYTGAEEGDYVHRIIHEEFDFEYVGLSVKNLLLINGMDVGDFFRDEEYWIEQDPELKEKVFWERRWQKQQEQVLKEREGKKEAERLKLEKQQWDRLMRSYKP